MIGERIKQARKATGLSLRTLADRAGVTAMAISKYEAGKSTPSSGVLLSLAKALGVRTEYFFRPVKIELQEVEYRKHSRLPKKALQKIEGDITEQIERFIELEQLLPNGRSRLSSYLTTSTPQSPHLTKSKTLRPSFATHGILVLIQSLCLPICWKNVASRFFSRMQFRAILMDGG